jgi:glycosyltransferase involved in cell wall biosynthesis
MTVDAAKIEQIQNNEREQSDAEYNHVIYSLTLIIPVYNEIKRLPKTIKRISEYCSSQSWDYEIIIAEDGSTDGTVNLIKDLLSKDDRIKLITNKERLGKGKAIKNGVAAANKKYVCYIDADLSSDPSEINRLLPYIYEFDIVIGSRILRGDLPPIERPFVRSFLSRCYSKLFRIMFRTVSVHDPQCGLKLFKSHVAKNVLSQVETTGFAFESEVLVKSSKMGLKIKEVPVNWKHEYGSKLNLLHETWIMAKDLLSVWYRVEVLKFKIKMLPT